MKFRNPWIDPRVTNVRSADLIRYMHLNGWEEFRSERRRMRLFQRSRSDFAILVPMADKADDYIESIIEAITQLAEPVSHEVSSCPFLRNLGGRAT